MHAAGINLLDGDMNRVVSIAATADGMIEIREECDGYFVKRCTKAEAIEALQEAVEWLKALS